MKSGYFVRFFLYVIYGKIMFKVVIILGIGGKK